MPNKVDQDATVAPASCSICWIRRAAGAAPGSPAATAHDGAIRAAAIAAPEATFCANHPTRSPKRDQIPIGPVIVHADEGPRILHASPDSRKVRDHLLGIVERIHARTAEDLTPRDSAARWQLEQFDDPRAEVELDCIMRRIAARPAERAQLLQLLVPGGELSIARSARSAVERKARSEGPDDAPADDWDDAKAPWIEQFTVAGRLLVLSSLAVGVATFFGGLVFRVERFGVRLSTLALGLAAIGVGAIYLRLGVSVSRHLGIRFRAVDRNRTDHA